MTSPTCPFCGEPAQLVSAVSFYRNRPDLAEKQLWHCRPCAARVGVHPGTTKPLGPLAKESTRKARRLAHEAFDPIWQAQIKNGVSKTKARRAAYCWLSEQLGGAQSNIGEMDEAQCRRVIEICRIHKGGLFISPLPGDAR